MLHQAVIVLPALLSFANAYPAMADSSAATLEARDNSYIFNPPGSVRAPCPGLNTLANHGYINRNGMGITAQQMQQGFLDAFNMGFDATHAGAVNALGQCSSITGKTCNAFNLDILDRPHAIEHDASLSRRDAEMAHDLHANNVAFNQTIWDRTLAIYGATSHIGLKFANSARRKRVEQAQGADFPGWFRENVGGSLAEHSFTLSTMNDPAMGVNINTPGANPQARVDWINYWFVNMRLPTALGWHKPSQTISLKNIQSLGAAISNAPTVTAAVGTSPYIRKRDLDVAAGPSPSYNLELNERSLEERGIIPLSALPSVIAKPAAATAVAVASSRASAAAGPPPAIPNAYFDVLTPQEWTSLATANEKYTSKYQTALDAALSDLLPPVGGALKPN